MDKINFFKPDITKEDIEAVVSVLKSGWITTGIIVKDFEEKIKQYLEIKHGDVVCLNSATAGLELVLRLFDIGPGDEVIVPAYTYTASASIISHVGAKIVLCDIVENSFEMDYSKLANLINSNTKAIIPVDLAGIPVDYQKIQQIIEDKKTIYQASNNIWQQKYQRILLLSDCAHSLGASYYGKKTGNIANFSVFSFHAVKNLTTAEGGCISFVTENDQDALEIKKHLYLLALHGQNKSALDKLKSASWEYDILFCGYKCNLTDMAAALGRSQLQRYPQVLEKRRQLVLSFQEKLAVNPNIEVINHFKENTSSSYHLLLIRIKGIDEVKRNLIIDTLANKYRVYCNVHYKPLPLLTAYKNLGFKIEDYPNAFNFYQNEITLPLYNTMTEQELDYICDSLLKVLANE